MRSPTASRIIDHGKIVALGTPDELKRQVAGDVVVVGTDNASDRVLELLRGTVLRPRGDKRRQPRAPLRRPWRNRDAADHSRPRLRRAFRWHHSR